MKDYDPEQSLNVCGNMIMERLNELDLPNEADDNIDFIFGEKTAYVECLEMIKELFPSCNLPDDIERLYPI